jgi:hypothetical protein
MAIEDELRELLRRIDAPVALKGYVSAIIEDTVHLCSYNEDRIALENLCDNLFEERVMISPEVRDRLQDYCQRFRVDSERRALLNALTPGSSGSRARARS